MFRSYEPLNDCVCVELTARKRSRVNNLMMIPSMILVMDSMPNGCILQDVEYAKP